MKLCGTRILLVDDAPAARTLRGDLLCIEGADVAESATGWRAAELVREMRFDVARSRLPTPPALDLPLSA